MEVDGSCQRWDKSVENSSQMYTTKYCTHVHMPNGVDVLLLYTKGVSTRGGERACNSNTGVTHDDCILVMLLKRMFLVKLHSQAYYPRVYVASRSNIANIVIRVINHKRVINKYSF